MTAGKRKGLGRGLESLLGASKFNAEVSGEHLESISLDQLDAGVYQPRTNMNEEALEALADSIRAQGVIQPIVVRRKASGRYEIIAGERRFRAALRVGLKELPAIVREVSDEAALAVALVENIQREALDPLEEARGIARLIEEFDLTHERAGEILGRSRSAVSNLLRLLSLPDPVQTLLHEGQLSMGHVRALLSLDVLNQIDLAQRAATGAWSVREIERQAQLRQASEEIPTIRTAIKEKVMRDPDVMRLEERLCDELGMTVNISHKKSGAGYLKIEYVSLEQLDDFLHLVRKKK